MDRCEPEKLGVNLRQQVCQQLFSRYGLSFRALAVEARRSGMEPRPERRGLPLSSKSALSRGLWPIGGATCVMLRDYRGGMAGVLSSGHPIAHGDRSEPAPLGEICHLRTLAQGRATYGIQKGYLVDLERFELSTSSMPWKRAPNCATGPLDQSEVLIQHITAPRTRAPAERHGIA